MAAMAPSAIQSAVASVALASTTVISKGQNASSGFQSSLLTKRGFVLARKLVAKSHGHSRRSSCSSRLHVRAVEDSSAGAATDSVVSEVAVLEEEPPTPGVGGTAVATKPNRQPGALQRGGTLEGKEALGKDPSKATLGAKSSVVQGDRFEDPRWINGNWDLSQFSKEGKVNWDGVIDAEVKRRKWLEDNPEASRNDEPVLFETSMVPWWAWVKRFHLPEAELLNGRAAMLGYVAAYFVDSLTGAGLVDQQNSFFGKLFLWATIAGVLLIRKNEDLDTIKALVKESTFYDKQWQATWKEDPTKEDKTQV